MFGTTMATTTAVEQEYELPTAMITVDDDQREHQNKVEISDNNNDECKQQQIVEDEDIEVMQSSSVIPAHLEDNVQEEDVLVEENVTPFYMNSGKLL